MNKTTSILTEEFSINLFDNMEGKYLNFKEMMIRHGERLLVFVSYQSKMAHKCSNILIMRDLLSCLNEIDDGSDTELNNN